MIQETISELFKVGTISILKEEIMEMTIHIKKIISLSILEI